MRFFTIDTRDHGFIELTDVDGTYWISLHRDGALVAGIPLSPFFSDGAKQIGLHHIREGLITPTEAGSVVTVTKEPRDWQRRRRLDQSAVVLVKTPPGTDGLALTQSTYDEYVENGRVHRRYHEFMFGGEMPPGITMLANNSSEEVPSPKEPEFLLELLPKAAFRIVQLGEVGRGPGTLSVRWSGQELVVKEFRPSWSPGGVAAVG